MMTQIASTVNSSQLNVTGLQEKMQLAIEHTLKAAQQVRLFFFLWCPQSHCLVFFLM